MKMDMELDTRGLEELLDSLGDAASEAVRPAAQAGAQVLYDAAKRRAPVSDRMHFFYGTHAKYGPYKPGNLRDSIYQVYSRDNSHETKAQYHVSFNFKKAPYGFMVEYGTSKAPAHPFIRPAMDLAPVAQDAMRNEVLKRIDEVLK